MQKRRNSPSPITKSTHTQRKQMIPPPPTQIKEMNPVDSFAKVMKDGFSFGVGSAIGSAVVRKVGDELFSTGTTKETANVCIESTKLTDLEMFEKYNKCVSQQQAASDIPDLSICNKILE